MTRRIIDLRAVVSQAKARVAHAGSLGGLGVTAPGGFEFSEPPEMFQIPKIDPRVIATLPPPGTLMASDEPWLGIRLQVVRVADDDGSNAVAMSDADIASSILIANRALAPGKIGLLWDPIKDSSVAHATRLNQQMAPGATSQYALSYPGKVAVFFRKRGGRLGYASLVGNYIVLPQLQEIGDRAGCANGKYIVLAHEMGHYLGLPHTFPVGDAIAGQEAKTAEAYFRRHGNMDGDGIPDTPDDPGPLVMARCLPDNIGTTVSWLGREWTPPWTNIMSYYDSKGGFSEALKQSFTPQQLGVMRNHIKARGLAFGLNTEPTTEPAPRAEDCPSGWYPDTSFYRKEYCGTYPIETHSSRSDCIRCPTHPPDRPPPTAPRAPKLSPVTSFVQYLFFLLRGRELKESDFTPEQLAVLEPLVLAIHARFDAGNLPAISRPELQILLANFARATPKLMPTGNRGPIAFGAIGIAAPPGTLSLSTPAKSFVDSYLMLLRGKPVGQHEVAIRKITATIGQRMASGVVPAVTVAEVWQVWDEARKVTTIPGGGTPLF